MRCICINSAGSEAEQGHKVKLKVLNLLNFLTLPSFSVTLPSCVPCRPKSYLAQLPVTCSSYLFILF